MIINSHLDNTALKNQSKLEEKKHLWVIVTYHYVKRSMSYNLF